MADIRPTTLDDVDLILRKYVEDSAAAASKSANELIAELPHKKSGSGAASPAVATNGNGKH